MPMVTTLLYPSVLATHSPNGWLGWLDVHPVRITHWAGFRWVRSSAETTGYSMGILYSSTFGASAEPTWAKRRPARTWTRSLSTSLRSLVRAMAGCPWVSSTITSTLRPAIWLPISSKYIWKPLVMSLPTAAAPPVIGARKPTLIGGFCAQADPATHAVTATTIAAASAPSLLAMSDLPRWVSCRTAPAMPSGA